MAYKVIILYQLYMPSYFLGTFTEYPKLIIKFISPRGRFVGARFQHAPIFYFLFTTIVLSFKTN